MSRLITTSILDAVDWCKTAPDSLAPSGKSWKEDAYSQLKATLGRAPWNPTPANLRGIDFEASIYTILNGKKEETIECSDHFRSVLMACKGGVFQKKTKTIIEMDGVEYCLYGKIDVFFPAKIVDIKTTAKYGGKDKYLGTSQHHLYCFGENIPEFEYVIAEFKSDEGKDIRAVHHVSYVSPSLEFEEAYIRTKIKELLAFLENYSEPGDLKELYNTTYCKY